MRRDAGIEHSTVRVQVGAQFRVKVGKGGKLENRDDRRKTPSLGKSEPGKRNSRLPYHIVRLKRAAERRVEEVLLREPQRDQLAGLGWLRGVVGRVFASEDHVIQRVLDFVRFRENIQLIVAHDVIDILPVAYTDQSIA